ncbi:hypothetical protein [Humidisolicoccus flavus]|uniref:hypothetical protein n=1 Tax=Humidisolicoccus flavus TaxID=3111414 RepID=UPI00324CB4D9
MWTTSIIAVAVILIAVLPMLARRDGVSPLTRPLSRKALLLLASQVGLLVVLMLASGMVSKLAAHGAWLILVAIVAFAGMWMLGRLYDRAQLVAMNGQTPRDEA